jgi:hypothetical protein
MSGGLATESLSGVSARINNSKKRPADWSTKLTRSLYLKCGEELVTLGDARVVMTLYAELGIESSPVALAMKWLSIAAETRTFEHRKAATSQVAFVLSRRLVSTPGTNLWGAWRDTDSRFGLQPPSK